MEETFIEIRGANDRAITINVKYLIKFEPSAEGSMVYVDDRGTETMYLADISYEALKALIKSKI